MTATRKSYHQGWMDGRYNMAYDYGQYAGSIYWSGYHDGQRARARMHMTGGWL
jgi:hypothetical protein